MGLDLGNGGFGYGFRAVDDIGELWVANDWMPWWSGDDRPEYKDASVQIDARRVRSGQHAQQWFNNWRAHTAGIYQRVEGVPVGAEVWFEAWVQCWSSGQKDPRHSDGRYRMRIGIDPYGGIDPESTDVVWSGGGDAVQPYDAYERLEVHCPARSDRVTVFVWGQAEWALRNNNAYVDDCRLWVEGGSGPGPTPPPTPDDRVEALIVALNMIAVELGTLAGNLTMVLESLPETGE